MLKGVMGLLAAIIIVGLPSSRNGSAASMESSSPREVSSDSHDFGDRGTRDSESQDGDVFSPPADKPAAQPDSVRPEGGTHRLSQADFNALIDARIGMAKIILQMSPQQAHLWPAIEEALRNALEVRYRHIAQIRNTGAEEEGKRPSDPVAIMRSRGETLYDQGDRLRKLAEAWQPLYQILTPEQKDRMRLVASHILCETRGDLGCRLGGDEDPETAEGRP